MKKKVLIVDDDRGLTDELKEALESEGLVVTTALDGFKGKELIEKSSYDIVLLDFKMPGPSGMELLTEVIAKKPKAKIFLISGKPFLDKFVNENGLASHVAGVLTKPFDVEELIQKIKLS